MQVYDAGVSVDTVKVQGDTHHAESANKFV